MREPLTLYCSLSLRERAGVRAGRNTPHSQCAPGLAGPGRSAGSPHAARKPRFAPNPLPRGARE
jgi:hypothetical protein